jgi:putative colanic acid biosynthesis glycosyltransferase
MRSPRLAIITVVKDPGPEFSLTTNSILELIGTQESHKFIWIILDGSAEACDVIKNVVDDKRLLKVLKYVRESDSGIYNAMNRGLSYIQGENFIFINAGDKILLDALEESEKVEPGLALCCRSLWHSLDGKQTNRDYTRKFSPEFGVMPNHQSMIFSNGLKSLRYNENFKIAADQDLKMTLWSQSKLAFSERVVSSCLTNGISHAKLTKNQIVNRTKESLRVFDRHMNKTSALMLTGLYFLRYLTRWNYKFRD